MAEKMRAWRIASPGPITTNLELVEDVPQPSQPLQKGQILVEVASASINPADYKVPELGMVAKAMIEFPKILGMDFSGQVISIGEDITDVKPGDAVLGRVNPAKSGGTLSEYVVVLRDEIAVIPSTVDLDQAAGVFTAGMTAYQTIAPYVKTGDKIFINGGSGGTGTFGIQIAKTLGCHVIVSCSTAKSTLCKALGADEIIDYKTTNVSEKLRELGKVFALVVDNIGNSPPDLFRVADQILLPGGKFKYVGGGLSFATVRNLLPSTLLPSFLGGASHSFEPYLTKKNQSDLEQVAKLLSEGKIKTVIDSTWKFEMALDAFKKLKTGSSSGKIIIQVNKRS
jgi:NADPH:quinone reductase-like Zn-dependent oxidoreductase